MNLALQTYTILRNCVCLVFEDLFKLTGRRKASGLHDDMTWIIFLYSRPQVLVLTGSPMDRKCLVDFSVSITKNVGLMVCGHVILVSVQQSQLID